MGKRKRGELFDTKLNAAQPSKIFTAVRADGTSYGVRTPTRPKQYLGGVAEGLPLPGKRSRSAAASSSGGSSGPTRRFTARRLDYGVDPVAMSIDTGTNSGSFVESTTGILMAGKRGVRKTKKRGAKKRNVAKKMVIPKGMANYPGGAVVQRFKTVIPFDLACVIDNSVPQGGQAGDLFVKRAYKVFNLTNPYAPNGASVSGPRGWAEIRDVFKDFTVLGVAFKLQQLPLDKDVSVTDYKLANKPFVIALGISSGSGNDLSTGTAESETDLKFLESGRIIGHRFSRANDTDRGPAVTMSGYWDHGKWAQIANPVMHPQATANILNHAASDDSTPSAISNPNTYVNKYLTVYQQLSDDISGYAEASATARQPPIKYLLELDFNVVLMNRNRLTRAT